MAAVFYVLDVLKHTAAFLCFGMLPFLLAATLMDYLSLALRRRLAATLGERGFARITAPGVVFHELCHAAACLLFNHRIAKLCLFAPETDRVLGYVLHTCDPRSPYQRIGNFFIGIAPVCGGVPMLWALRLILLPETDDGDFLPILMSAHFWLNWQSWLYLYASVCVAAHLTLSSSDLQGALDGALALLILILLFEFLTAWHDGIQIALLSILSKLLSVAMPPLAVAAMLMSALILVLPKVGGD